MTPPSIGPDVVLRIVTEDEWATAGDPYHPPELDDVGFIHLSNAEQVAAVADLRFAGRDDVLVLVIDVDQLGDDLVWEEGTGVLSGSFPHLRAPLRREAVRDVVRLRGADGRFVPPTT